MPGSKSETADRPAVEMVRPDEGLLRTHCHDAIMPLFCPTRQPDFVKSKIRKTPMPTKGRLLCMGLFSRFLLTGRKSLGPDRSRHEIWSCFRRHGRA
jgi:hypothetical protein